MCMHMCMCICIYILHTDINIFKMYSLINCIFKFQHFIFKILTEFRDECVEKGSVIPLTK